MNKQDPSNNINLDRLSTRRNFIKGAAIIGLGGGFLAACGGSDGESTSTSSGGGGSDGTAASNTTAASDSGSSAGSTATTATSTGGAAGLTDIAALAGMGLKIGFVTPRTGPLAPFGEADDFVLGRMREMFGDSVEIIDKDAESDSAIAGNVTQELISEGVHLIVAGDTPDISVPVAAACDLGEVPCITALAPWQPHFAGVGGDLTSDAPTAASDYNYHFFWGLEDVIANFIALWEQSGAPKVVGGMWPNDPDGNAWSDATVGFPPALEAAGFTVVDPGRFELETQDFSAIIAQFKDAGVQIVSGVVPPPVFANFEAQSLQQDFKPQVITMAKALLFPSAVETYPQGAGLSSEIWWSNRHPFSSSLTGQSAGELATEFETAINGQWTQPLGFAHAMFEVAIDAAVRAGSTDADAILGALAETNLSTIVGQVNFATGPVPNVSKTPLVAGQWVPGTDYPLELAINVNEQLPEVPADGDITPIEWTA